MSSKSPKAETERVLIAQTTNRYGYMRYTLYGGMRGELPAFSITEQEQKGENDWGPEVTINSDASPTHECFASFMGCIFARLITLERRVTFLATQQGAQGTDIEGLQEQFSQIIDDLGLNYDEGAEVPNEIAKVLVPPTTSSDEELLANCVDG